MLEKTKTRNTAEEYVKASSAVGLFGLLSLMREFEEQEDYEECQEVLKALKTIRVKHEKQLKVKLPINIRQIREADLLRIGSTREEQKESIENQKERIKIWLAK